jgi:HlyD family secretion protein
VARRSFGTAVAKPVAWAALVAATALGFAGGCGSDRPASGQPSDRTPPAHAGSASRSEVRALARLEPESGVITVGARPGARVERIEVKEGQELKAGDLLAELEGHDQRKSQLALAEAQKKSAEMLRRLRRDGLKLEREKFDRLKQPRLDSLRGIISDLKARVGPGTPKDAQEKEKEKEKPASPGFGQGMVPQIVQDAAAAQLRTELARSELQLKELEESLKLLDRQRALEDEPLADESPDQKVLDRQVELAKAELAQSEVRAPAPGRVLAVVARAGEVSAGPLLTMGDVKTMVARAEVFQSDVLDVAAGDPAEVTILGRAVTGTVTRVGTTVGRNTISSLDPAALADRRVVEVVVKLADPALASRLVNMQVDVSIRPQAR